MRNLTCPRLVFLTGVLLAFGACGDDDDDQGVIIDAAPAPDQALGEADAAVDAGEADAPDNAGQDADLGPDASPDAAPLGPETCDNLADDNGDTLADCADPLCADFFPCQAPACPAGQTQRFFAATDLPRAFGALSTTTSNIAITGVAGQVTDVAVKMTVAHHYVTDIVATLVAPSGLQTDVTSHNGSNGHNYVHTVFADDATKPVTAGLAPFTGKFRPEQAFTRLDGESPNGTWAMRVEETFDDDGSDVELDQGGFASYDLMLCVCENCEIGGACNDTTDNDGDGAIDCTDSDCAGNVRCIPETVCTGGVDEDLDGKTDCADDTCDGKNGCEFGLEETCGDALDNDGDALADCADTDCATSARCLPESNCTNGIDDDLDGAKDCADPGCVFTSPMCQPAESVCGDAFDNDGDGVSDCADSDCAITCAGGPCPAGQLTLTASGTGLPLAIPDNNATGAQSTVNLSAVGTITSVRVMVSVVHTFIGDVVVSLVPPPGAPTVTLAANHGSSEDNFTHTIFSDAATTAIASGTPPYTGAFKPDQPLSALNGKPVAGAWTLKAVDNAAILAGTLTEYVIQVCYTPQP